MNQMAAKGWICVAINYRLSPRDAWPAHIVDVKRAIAWIKDNIADYGGDPDYLAVTGGSAGGHLTALAALTAGDPEFQPGFEDADTSVQAAVPFYGIYDFAGSTGLTNAIGMRDAFLGPRVMQTTWQDAPDVYEAASPILRITPDAPDFFVIHGELDTLVAVDQARLFVAELRRTSTKSVVYAELPGTQHAFDVFHSIRSAYAVRAVDRYLTWHWNTWRHGLEADSGVEPGGDLGRPHRLTRATPATTRLAPVMPADLLEHARAAKGFMPEDEGAAAAPLGARAAAARPGARGRHLLRQVGDLARRRRARGRRDGLHRRPPPRLGGEPGRLGAPRRRPRRPRPRRDGHPADLPPHHRARRARGAGRRRRRALGDGQRAGGVRRCRCCSSTAGTASSRPAPTSAAGRGG